MATKTATKPVTVPQQTAIVPQSLSHDDFMALLAQAGMVPQSTGDFRRMSLKAGMLVTDPGTPNEEQWPPVKNGPVMLVRIVKPPVYYNAFFCSENEQNDSFDARKIGRGDLNGKFVKKYDDPTEQAADPYANLEGYEAIAAYTGARGGFRGDIQLQIVPDNGQLTGEEPVYTLSLGSTSAIDFRGSKQNPQGGVVQEKNFIVQLGELAMRKAQEAGITDPADIKRAILDGLTALRLGDVIAAVHIRQASNPNNGNTWNVISFEPIHFEVSEDVAALPDPVATGPEQNPDDIPF